MKKTVLMTWLLVCFVICNSFAVEVTLLGPKQYLRAKQFPTKYSDTFPGRTGQGTLYIKNGTESGQNRIDSAIIKVNGATIFGTSSFDLGIYNLLAPINILENNTISVELRSAPGRYLTIEIKQEMNVEGGRAIGPEGGIIKIENPQSSIYGVEIAVPPGALANTEIITLEMADVYELPDSYTYATKAIKLNPSGLVFYKGVCLTMPYDEKEIDENKFVFVLLYGDLNEDPNDWEIPECVNFEKTENYIIVKIHHFSSAIVGYNAPEWIIDRDIYWRYPDNTLSPNFAGLCKPISVFSYWYFVYHKEYKLNCAYPFSIRQSIAGNLSIPLLPYYIFNGAQNDDVVANTLLASLKGKRPHLLNLLCSSDGSRHIVVVTGWKNTGSDDRNISGYFELYDSDISFDEIRFSRQLFYTRNYGQSGTLNWDPKAIIKYDRFELEDPPNFLLRMILATEYVSAEIAQMLAGWSRNSCGPTGEVQVFLSNFDDGTLQSWQTQGNSGVTISLSHSPSYSLQIGPSSYYGDLAPCYRIFEPVPKGTIEFWMYVPSSNPGGLNLYVSDSGGLLHPRFMLGTGADGSVAWLGVGEVYHNFPTPARFSLNQWNKVIMRWDAGTNQFRLIINGTDFGIGYNANSGGPISEVYFKKGDSNYPQITAFFDDIKVVRE